MPMTHEQMAEALASGRATYTSSWTRDAAFYVANNHVLLSCLFAHPAHPFSRCRRLLVLLNSLSFAFFVTAFLHALVPLEVAQVILQATIGTILQLAFDLPAAMLGTCACAGSCLPAPVRACCHCVSFATLSLHCCLGCVYALIGLLLLALLPSANLDDVWPSFQETKVSAFVWAVPMTLIIYALLRECERGQRPIVGRDLV